MGSFGIVGSLGILGIIKELLECLVYISAIIVLFKASQALSIYINKNSR
ncbi:hypothetical protein [uncultured Clostridium sp.]|nr:hypothetical protein [uncultured Clostridium sp.]